MFNTPRIISVFILLSISSVAALAAPIEITVSKTRFFIQTNLANPALDFDNPYVFVATAQSEDPLLFLGDITITPPGRPSIALTLTADLNLRYDAGFATKAQFDAAFPDGVYQAEISDLFGDSKHIAVELSGDRYPAVPVISNFTDAQAIGAASDFELNWPTLTGTILSDSIALLVVEGNLGQQQAIFQNVISATPQTTGMLIPANTLRTDGIHFAALDFHRLSKFTTNSTGDTMGALFGSVTQFPLRAPTQPRLRVVAGEPFRFRFNTVPNRRYDVESSIDMIHWDPIADLTADSGYLEVTSYDPFNEAQVFRVKLRVQSVVSGLEAR